MFNIIKQLERKNLINPPVYVLKNTQYLTLMGSQAYGVANTNDSEEISDWDIYGFCIPPKDMIFPHLRGEILGFGRQRKRFDQYQITHIKDTDTSKEYDITIYSIVKYFNLMTGCNPNMIDSIFTPQQCVLHSSPIGDYVRENRKLFLSKYSYHKFKGYAYAQMHKIKNKRVKRYLDTCDSLNVDYKAISLKRLDTELENRKILQNSIDSVLNPIHTEDIVKLRKLLKQCLGGSKNLTKRVESIKKYGFDLKFSYHIVRLLEEVTQILVEHDLDLQRNREQLKAIRRGEWSLQEIEKYFTRKEAELEKIYTNSTLRDKPDEPKIKQVLLNCLEMHFGSLKDCIVKI